jgi:hypothetical protein
MSDSPVDTRAALADAEKAKLDRDFLAEYYGNRITKRCVEHLDVLAAHVRALAAELDAVRLERDGERKAKELALAGLESVTELYDGKKHECRTLTAERDAERAKVAKLRKAFRAVFPTPLPDAVSDSQVIVGRVNAGDYRRALAALEESK